MTGTIRKSVCRLVVLAMATTTAAAEAQDEPPPLPAASSSSSAAPAPSDARRKPPPPPPPPPPGAVPTAPPPYYPPPAQPPPYYGPAVAPPPYYAPPSEQPRVIPGWDPSEPVPEGYKPVSKPQVGLLGIGIGLLSAGWVTTVVVAASLGEAAKEPDSGVDPNVFIPMYFPVVGPIVTLATWRPGPAEMGLLLTSAVFQLSGSVGVLVGSLRRSYKLVYTGETASIDLTPAVSPSFVGLQSSGHF